MKMNPKDRWIVMTVALAGVVACSTGVVMFFMTMINNTLPWDDGPTAPSHYLAVGKSYSQGFTIGFFLAFCLALVAITFAAWFDDMRRARAAAAPTPESRSADTRLVLGLRAPTRDLA